MNDPRACAKRSGIARFDLSHSRRGERCSGATAPVCNSMDRSVSLLDFSAVDVRYGRQPALLQMQGQSPREVLVRLGVSGPVEGAVGGGARTGADSIFCCRSGGFGTNV